MRAPLLIVVRGVPAPQGSKSANSVCGQDAQPCGRCRRRHVVRISMHESSKALGAWRELVRIESHNVMVRAGLAPVTGPLVVAATFTLPRPGDHFVNRNVARGLLKPSAPGWPTGYPDTSKLARGIEDAMTDGGVWADDAQVVDYVRCAKVYPRPRLNGPDPALGALAPPAALAGIPDADALYVPGVVIRVTRPDGWRPDPAPAATLDEVMT